MARLLGDAGFELGAANPNNRRALRRANTQIIGCVALASEVVIRCCLRLVFVKERDGDTVKERSLDCVTMTSTMTTERFAASHSVIRWPR
jgi:hypothetical protein